jgi:hypothetical protein
VTVGGVIVNRQNTTPSADPKTSDGRVLEARSTPV